MAKMQAQFRKFAKEVAAGKKHTISPSEMKKLKEYMYIADPLSKEGVLGVSHNLRILSGAVTYKSTLVAAQLAAEILKASQLRVPIDTGELKESGIARLGITGRGTSVRTIAKGNSEPFSDNVELVDTIQPEDVKDKKYVNLGVQYTRFNDLGEDIALWAHEDLNPYGSGKKPQARTPNTGPKYLKIPFELVLGKQIRALKSAIVRVGNDIQESMKVIEKAKHKHMVDQKRIDENKLYRKLLGEYISQKLF